MYVSYCILPLFGQKIFVRIRTKWSSEMCGFSATVYSDESQLLVRSHVSDRMDNLYLLESPLLKMLLFERTEHVNPLFSARNTDGEHQKLFQELLSQPNKLQEYYNMTHQTLYYILNAIEESIKGI